jgi:predicted porin
MYKKQLITIIATVAATNAFAQQTAPQPNVSVYGVLDTMVRYTTNVVESDGTTVGNQTKMGDGGALQGSRLGFKGEEDLGGNTSAVFQLEMGFLSSNGSADQQGQLFGRQAYVGLKNNQWGELDVGRQYGVAFDTLGNYDPVGMGNMPENEWQLFLMGVRFDNTLKYTNNFGPIRAEVQYSMGGQAGNSQIGSTTGLGLTYTQGPLSVGVFDQMSYDADSNKLNVAGIGASYEISATTLFLNYFNAKRDAGFEKASNNSGGPLANTSLLGNADNTLRRTDGVTTVGLQYKATPQVSLTLGYMTDSVSNETSTGNSGKISTGYGLVNYHFSKRTDVYVGLDYTKVSGGEIDNGDLTNTVLQFAGAPLGGNTGRTGVAIGLRHSF